MFWHRAEMLVVCTSCMLISVVVVMSIVSVFKLVNKKHTLFTSLTEIANHGLVIDIIGVIGNNLLSYLLIYRSVCNNRVYVIGLTVTGNINNITLFGRICD